ncbi:hypothetical protein BE22_0065 [Staphylococcus phage vB_SepS_BE22]|nr:hypothetical protein BE22_0065 [Staphylococcus phage vB_SepS_BE22]
MDCITGGGYILHCLHGRSNNKGLYNRRLYYRLLYMNGNI